MRPEISDLSSGNEWRLISSGVSDDAYFILCDRIDQIFKNLFKLDYNVKEIIENKEITRFQNDISKYKTYVPFKTDLFSIGFVFNITKVDELFILGDCIFSVTDSYLLDKLPMGSAITENAYCVCFFNDDELMSYQSTSVTYLTTVSNPKKFRGFNYYYVNLSYTYYIDHLDRMSFQLEYTYEDDNLFYSKEPSKHFVLSESVVSDHMLLKIRQLYKLLSFYSSGLDLSSFYSLINYSNINDAVAMYDISLNFIRSDNNEHDNLLLLDMLKI